MAKRALGRGLHSLMPEISEQEESIRPLPISSVFPNPKQPRGHFREDQLQELAQSIAEKGIIQPLLVARQQDNRYMIIAGERRYRAALLAKLTTVPAIIKSFTEEERLEIGLIENIQREDLNAIEEARGYHSLMTSFGYTQEEIAKKIGKSRSAIANTLRLLRLPADIQEGLLQQKISAGHARALLAIDDEYTSQTGSLYRLVVDHDLSVRATERAAKMINNGQRVDSLAGELFRGESDTLPRPQPHGRQKSDSASREDPKLQPELREMENSLIQTLGTKVEIRGSEENGKIVIQYYNGDDLKRLHDLLLHNKG